MSEHDESEEDEYEEEGYEEDESDEEEGEERRPVTSFTTYDDGSYSVTRYEYEDEQESDCFVATACYGSALDEHVMFLRRFRDREVMETDIGRGFMRMFNALYYSFSPSLASYLRRHRGAKLMVRCAMVAPTIHLLRLSRYLTKPMSRVSREARIAATGSTFVLMWFIFGWILLYLIS